MCEERMKTLIESYNYDSFGNEVFTRLLLFLLATCPHTHTQCLLVEEVLARYPFLFYYAAEKGLYGDDSIYLQGKSIPEMNSIIEMLDAGKKTKDPSNLLRRFLLRKWFSYKL